ncbi:MAG: GNAT family N-acetyltransferase [Candidatus Binataceae bacterium]|nr:GNAT family N-acetyltransferase [Candidatus Binataceae bacterium]
MTATIRFATPDDAVTIERFIRGLADYEREPGAVCATAAVLRTQMMAENPPFECLLAEHGGAPIGFALFYRAYSTWLGHPLLFLEDLFVDEACRAAGAGIALIKRLAAIAAERGWARMEWRVLDWNTPAQRFYRALGANPADDWTVWRVEGEALARLARGAERDDTEVSGARGDAMRRKGE